MVDISTKRDTPPSRTLLQAVLHDRVLASAFVVCTLLLSYQLTVTVLQPPWIKPATDWLRTGLAWPQLAVEAWVAIRLYQRQQPDAVTGLCITLGMFCYALGRTSYAIADLAIYPHGVPYPSLPDLFFLLQYPCFIVALFLYAPNGRRLPNLRIIVDAVLWMSAVSAVSWYFVLLPLVRQAHEPPVGRNLNMLHQICDLVLFYGLVVALTRPCRTPKERLVVSLMGVAVLSLFIADTWAALLMLHAPYTYRTGSAPDLFWFLSYLLLPLAALVRLRLIPVALPSRPAAASDRLTWHQVVAGIRFVLPGLAVLVAGVAIIIHVERTSPHPADLSAPTAVAVVLLLLATLRPAVMFVEHEQLRRERDAARAQETAWRLANERMETFLSVVAHELKTPLASLTGYVHLMARRLDTLLRLVRTHDNFGGAADALRTLIDWSDQSVRRMDRLVDDVLDESRVRQGRLAVRPQQCDLVRVVGQSVAEQLALNPERIVHWVPEVAPVPVLADANRIEQVVTNYLSNALKFSRAEQPIEVCVQRRDGEARVAVHDEGVGIPLTDQPHIWERFYQAEGDGTGRQSGSQVGFGIGLYLSKAIIDEHQGQVGVESAPGHGTTVWFTLPVAVSPIPSPPETGADCSVALPSAW